ncbi:MAG TPA: alpha/beta hydrolase-fold protein, partial [Candidatus Acidoferrum sp.]|nr:alpha/beta hydrolase-fold protein [Candidatus Acidoferrum sp.]
MNGMRAYRVHLPANYAASQKRYPVIYWLHGYETGGDERDSQLTAWAAKHDAIVIDTGPVETSGNYPLYLSELADRVDRTLRTMPGRDHRGVAGFGTGGFLALWLAANSPDLIGSASALSPARSAAVGPKGFEVDTVLEDLHPDYESVRTRLFNSGDVPTALAFHMDAFASPLPRPKVFAHADPYPNFSIWSWEVISNRRRPGVTQLENVSSHGFHSVVREWLPDGAIIPDLKLTVTSPALYVPRTSHTVTYVRLADRKTRRALQRADAQGRMTFELDGGEWEVGVGSEAVLALAGYEVADAAWATAGVPVKLRLLFWNKGAARSITTSLKWESPTSGVKFAEAGARVPMLAPGESVAVPVTFTAATALAGAVKIGAAGLAIEIPVYPPAAKVADFKLIDETDHDGHASPGEGFAISLPDGPAELITRDPCVDTSVRIVEEGTRYTHAVIRPNCEPGRTVRMLARTSSSYAAIEFPIWYKLP